ncbi:EAL domain-containing protein [Variovorax sp. LjRoot290]|uniref:bifunctional diguanylate cyclase/phosphodiesterase n=1 Tax=Variovorax sp. LjRoot290 TaxID=3342316 RepID=UPI003ECDED0B
MNRRLPRRTTAFIYGVATLFLLGILASATIMTWEMRKKAMSDSERLAMRFVSGSEAALNRGLLSIDMLLAVQGQFLQSSTAATVATNALRPDALQLLDAVVRQNLLVRHIALLRPDGAVLSSSDRRRDKLTVQVPPEFLERVAAQSVSTLDISTPTISQFSSQQVLYFARSMRLSDGSTIVAVAEVPTSLLTTILTQGADIKGLQVTLERNAGPLLASVPAHDDRSGRAILPALSEQTSDGRAMRMAARLSGEQAIVVARPTLHRNLLIVASIPLSFVLEDWRAQRSFILGTALSFALMILLVSCFAHIQLRRLWRSSAQLVRSKSTLDQALESMVDGFVLLDAQDHIVTWNRRFLKIFPWAEATIASGLPFQCVIDQTAARLGRGGPESQRHAEGRAESALAGGTQDEEEIVLPGGQIIVCIRSRTPDGGLVCVYRDVTEKRRHTAAIVESKAQLQATLDALPDLLLEAGLDGRCHLFHAPRAAPSVVDAQDPVGRLLSEFLPAQGAAEVMAALHEAHTVGFSRGRQFERPAAQGATWFEISVSRKYLDEEEEPRFIVILRNITDTKLAAREIEHLAFYDVLTGLPNRRLLLNRLEGAIDANARHGRHGALLFLDLDNFKLVNDAHGHETGNVLLKHVATRLNANTRNGDTLARLGGDEFVMMLQSLGEDPDVALRQTAGVGEAMLAELSQPYLLGAHQYHGTCSMGVTLFDGQQQSLEALLKQADIAMYYAKTAGGNAMRFFEAPMQATITARATLERELRSALAGDQFLLHYQSQVTSSGQITSAEVLLRWQHPTRGMVPPFNFIDLAEETGLIVPLGLWVLEAACEQLERWSHHPSRRDLGLAVNVSARQFRESDFVQKVREVLSRTGADPTRLKLELTESLVHDNVTDTIEKMKSLAAMGIRFSLDDFGTGYSSLSYMTQLPLNQIKIDKSFVQNIGIDPKVESIIQTIIGMARNLELEVVAEGVETRQQLGFLEKHRCTLFQGYLFSKPVPLPEFEAQLDLEMVG